MKKVLKSRIFAFILGALIFGGIGAVSAYAILASDIGFTPKDSTWKKSDGTDITNVKDAIDELYDKANKDILNKLTLKIRTESYSRDYNGTTNYNLNAVGSPISSNYKYFKITNVERNTNLSDYGIWGYNKKTASSGTLQLNKVYELSEISNIWVVAWSNANGQMGYVIPTIEFYN